MKKQCADKKPLCWVISVIAVLVYSKLEIVFLTLAFDKASMRELPKNEKDLEV